MTSDTVLDASLYREHSKIQHELAIHASRLLAIKGQESILDLGCGDGRVSYFLKKFTTGEVLGIDPDPDMISLARSFRVQGLAFVEDRAESFRTEKKFDIITCFSALHWICPDRFFETVRFHLKKSGKALILTYPKDSLFWQLITGVLERPQWRECKKFRFYLSEAYRKIAMASGLSEKIFKSEEKTAVFKDWDSYVSSTKGWLPLMTDLPKDQEASFFDQLFEQAKINGYIGYPEICIPYTTLTMLLAAS